MRSYLLAGWQPVGLALLVLVATWSTARGAGQAIPGRPFGVATLTVPLDQTEADLAATATAFSVEEIAHRVYYPSFSTALLPGLAASGIGRGDLTVSFLFTGNEPLRLTVYTPKPQTIDLLPQPQPPRIYNRLLNQWWRQYNASAREIANNNDYPPLAHVYLTSMLGQRLGLRPPLLSRLQETRQPTELQQTLELLAGTEKIREGLLRQSMQPAPSPAAPADLPLPTDLGWSDLPLPPVGDEGAIEPIARHVPPECFYMRFGSFENYLWLSRLMREYGGDISRMVTLRGYDERLNEKLQRQLALQESAAAELFGGQVIADVAIIGRDLYLQDGAAMGVLFQAKNNFALSASFNQQRSASLAAHKERGATLETVELAGEKVSLLSTPDNYLRSYYAKAGDFHLLTTSHEIARRFLEVSQSGGSLGATAEFQLARQNLPLEREDTIFAYFSSRFFWGLVSPQYQVELSRRLRAATDLQLVQLARLAAAAEGQPGETIDELIAGGFLPAGFGWNSDGSGTILERRRALDSLRGGRGTLTPIPDVQLRGVTAEENEQYLRRVAYYQENWRQMDPLMVGIKRFALGDENLERVVIDANVSPLAEDQYGWALSMIGPPTDVRIVAPADELMTMQATLNGGLLAPSILPHHLFVGVRDIPPNVNLQPQGFLEALRLLRETPGYLGSWPKLGFLDWLPLNLGGSVPDPAGFSRLLLGVWRWQGDGFSVLSFHRDVLERTITELRSEPTDNPAQIRVRIGDISQSQLSGWFNFLSYERATQTSVGNAKLLHALSQQFRVPRAEARQVAEQLLDAELVCSLGGEYQLAAGDLPTWRSTRWPQLGQPFPSDFQAPWVKWFRGLTLDLTKYEDRLVMRAEVDLQRSPAEASTVKLPLFDLFGGSKKE